MFHLWIFKKLFLFFKKSGEQLDYNSNTKKTQTNI